LLSITAFTGLTGLEATFTRLTGLVACTGLLTAEGRTGIIITTLSGLIATLTGLAGLVATVVVVTTRPRTITGALGCAALQTCTESFRTEAALILFMIVVTRTLIGWTLSAVNTGAR
jgi:hypothetical protein